MTYSLVENSDHRPSVTALDEAEHVLGGAFYLNNRWNLYFTQTVMPPTVPFIPRHVVAFTKDDAVWFVQILAHWYSERRTA